MTSWILDTDTVSLLLAKHPIVSQRVRQSGADVAISIVTAQELFNGWVVRINNATASEDLIRLYDRLYGVLLLCKKVPILTFDSAASLQLDRILREHPQLIKQRLQKDMRIAAIALANDAVVVTRNYRDFSLVPGLLIEDWSISRQT